MNYYDPENDRENRAYDRMMTWVSCLTFAVLIFCCYALLKSFYLLPK